MRLIFHARNGELAEAGMVVRDGESFEVGDDRGEQLLASPFVHVTLADEPAEPEPAPADNPVEPAPADEPAPTVELAPTVPASDEAAPDAAAPAA